MSIEAELVAVKEEVKIKEECDDELLDILPSTSKLIPEDDKEAIQASLKIDPEQDLKFLAGTSQGDSEYHCFEEKQFKMENVEPEEGITSEDEDQSDSESEDLSDEGPPKIKSEELIIKSESAVDSDARKIQDDGKNHVCDQCSYRARRRYDVRKHIEAIHGDGLPKQHACPHCSYKTNRRTHLRSHMLVHEKNVDKNLCCELCTYRTHRKGYLKRHMKSHKAPETRKVIKKHVCDICNYRTNVRRRLTIHLNTVHNKDSKLKYPCDICHFITHYEPYLKKHKLTVHEKGPVKGYNCQQCDYKTNTKAYLDFHMRKHNSNIPTHLEKEYLQKNS